MIKKLSCRYRFRKSHILSKEEVKKFGIEKKDKSEVTLETEFEKIKQVCRKCHIQNSSFVFELLLNRHT